MNISNYALMLEKKAHGYLPINEAADMQTEAGLAKLMSGQNGGAYQNQWDQLISDYESKKGAAGTYKVMIKHDNKTDMIFVEYTIGADGKPVKGSIKLATGTGAAGGSENAGLKLSQSVIDKLLAKIAYVTKATNIDESQLAYLIEAVLYHSTSNSFNEKAQADLVNALFNGTQKSAIGSAYYVAMDSGVASNVLAKSLLYPGSMNINKEDDEDCQAVISIIGNTPKIASVNITDDAKIKKLAQAIFNIVDDTFVTEDEESIACMGVVSLNRASYYKLAQAWNSIHKSNANGKSLSEFIAAELDDADCVELFNAMVRGISGSPSDQAKELLKEPTE